MNNSFINKVYKYYFNNKKKINNNNIIKMTGWPNNEIIIYSQIVVMERRLTNSYFLKQ